ncbi:MAG: hypothetical protein M1167_03750 [Chloroflexi bacterium]|nr:hypothetical protein [Chloroflexota bacterium]
MRKRLTRKRCIVCGNPTVGFSGYVFYESGRTQLNAPFCQEHLEKAPQYAVPVFENQAALDIFQKMFPVTYLQDVKGKPTLYFGNQKTASSP